MNNFENLAFLSNEKNIEQFLNNLELPAYAKVAMLEKILAKETEKYLGKVQQESEEIQKMQKEEEEKKVLPIDPEEIIK